MTEYKVWAYARSAAPNLPALEEQLAESRCILKRMHRALHWLIEYRQKGR